MLTLSASAAHTITQLTQVCCMQCDKVCKTRMSRTQNQALTNVLVQLSHEGLAEASDLRDGSAFGVEVRASLSSSHGECCQAVLEDLLKTQKLDDAESDAGGQSQTALHVQP